MGILRMTPCTTTHAEKHPGCEVGSIWIICSTRKLDLAFATLVMPPTNPLNDLKPLPASGIA